MQFRNNYRHYSYTCWRGIFALCSATNVSAKSADLTPQRQRKTPAPCGTGADLQPWKAGLVAGRFEVMQDRGTRVEGNPGRPRRARIVARTVPAALGGGHDVARLIGEVGLA